MASTEKRLGELHKALAEKLIKLLEGDDVSPASMAVAAKFLKDNAITADVEQNDDLATLKDQLAAKPSKRDLKDAMAAIGQDLLQ